MISKQVTDRQKSAEFVAASINTHQGAIHTQISSALTPYLRDGEEMPDTELLLDLIKRSIQGNSSQLVDADRLLSTERAEDSALRDARDPLINDARDLVGDLASIIKATFGLHVASVLGLTTRMPSDPTALAEWLVRLCGTLRTFVWPAPRRANESFDVAVWIAHIEVALQAIDANTKALAQDLRQTDEALSKRDLQQTAYDTAFIHGVSVVESLCRFADTPKLLHVADRIRPSRRRPGQTNEFAEGVTPPPEPASETEQAPDPASSSEPQT